MSFEKKIAKYRNYVTYDKENVRSENDIERLLYYYYVGASKVLRFGFSNKLFNSLKELGTEESLSMAEGIKDYNKQNQTR